MNQGPADLQSAALALSYVPILASHPRPPLQKSWPPQFRNISPYSDLGWVSGSAAMSFLLVLMHRQRRGNRSRNQIWFRFRCWSGCLFCFRPKQDTDKPKPNQTWFRFRCRFPSLCFCFCQIQEDIAAEPKTQFRSGFGSVLYLPLTGSCSHSLVKCQW